MGCAAACASRETRERETSRPMHMRRVKIEDSRRRQGRDARRASAALPSRALELFALPRDWLVKGLVRRAYDVDEFCGNACAHECV